MILTTRYDKIGDERKKVYILRGEESYARTIDLDFNHTVASSGENLKGYLVTFNITLYRHLGDSLLTLYDGDEVIDSLNTHEYTSNYTFSNIRLKWGVEHKLWVKYKSNNQTMGKKSKSITLNRSVPANFIPTITYSSSNQLLESSSNTINGSVTFQGSAVDNGTTVNIYFDGVLKSTVTTSSGNFTTSLSNLTKGMHTITVEVEASSNMNGKRYNKSVMVGYDVKISQYPNPFINGSSNIFKFTVKNWNGNVVSGAGVSFNGSTYTTNSQGIATATLTSMITGTYSATYNGSTSNSVNITSISPTRIDLISTNMSATLNEVLGIQFRLSGNGSMKGIPITITTSTNIVKTLTTDSDGVVTFNYTGTGAGVVSVTATYGSLSTTATITDAVSINDRVNDESNITWITSGNTTVTPLQERIDFVFNSIGSSVEFETPLAYTTTMEFDVVVGVKTNYIYFAFGNIKTPIGVSSEYVGSHIKLKYLARGSLEFYINNRLIKSIDASSLNSTSWSMGLGTPQSYGPSIRITNASIGIKNLKIY